jgi:hypothetical protein
LSVTSKEYDDEDSAILTGTPVLSGVVVGDTSSDISLAGAANGSFASVLPGSHSVPVGGLSITGNKQTNYLLQLPTLTGVITPREITVTAQDQSSNPEEDETIPCQVSTARLLPGHQVVNPVCQTEGEAPRGPGNYEISVTAVGVRLTSDSSDITDRYLITSQRGTLTVLATAVTPVALEADDLILVYGDELFEFLGSLVESDEPPVQNGKRIGVLAKAGGTRVPGTLVQKIDSSSVTPGRYPAGLYSISMSFTPADPEKFGSATAVRQVSITKRSLSVSVAAQSKVYDGTTTAQFGTPSLTGVLEDDTVSLAGSLSGVFDSADVGDEIAVSGSGLSLGGTHANNYSLAAVPALTANITPRPLAPSINPRDKTYDGTTAVSFDTPTLPQGGASGVVASDSSAVSLSGSPSGVFSSADVGNAVSVNSLSGLSLTGARSGNYSLTLPGSLSARIIPRVIEIHVANASMLVGDPEPTYSLTVDEDFVGADTKQSVLGTVEPAIRGSRNFSFAGTKEINASIALGTNPNYQVVVTPGTLFIAEIFIGVTEQDDGQLGNRDVECGCEGLKPNSPVTLTIFSVETRILTTTTDSTGTCPLMQGTIPNSVLDGSHTLEVKGVFPDDSVARYQLPVIIPATEGPPEPPPTSDPPRTSRPPGSAPPGNTEPTSSPSPFIRPFFGTPPVSLNAESDNPLPPSNPGLPSPGAQVFRSFDLGDGKISFTLDLWGSQGIRNIRELSQERMRWFQPLSETRVEILGARTGARFVVSGTEALDSVTAALAIKRSLRAQASDFFELTDVTPSSPSLVAQRWDSAERDHAIEIFRAVGLGEPQQLADFELSTRTQWVGLTANARTFAPGTIVYLMVTSEPVVLAEAVVARDGTATLVGALPIDVLSAGEHRVRLVGVRSLPGVSVDEQGEVQLSIQLVEEINRFDPGTQARVVVVGSNSSGGEHLALRVVPLVPQGPWWTLWLIVGLFALLGLVKHLGLLPRRPQRILASVFLGASALPAVFLGWLSTVTAITWWGLALGLVASVLIWLIPQGSATPSGQRTHHAVA